MKIRKELLMTPRVFAGHYRIARRCGSGYIRALRMAIYGASIFVIDLAI